MAAADPTGGVTLDGWYNIGDAVQEVSERDLNQFLTLDGYQNNHLIAALTESDLQDMGFRAGHAKLNAPHLGGLNPAPLPAVAPPNVTVTAIMDPAADARSQAASDATVEALKRLTKKDVRVDRLNGGALERPTVKRVM